MRKVFTVLCIVILTLVMCTSCKSKSEISGNDETSSKISVAGDLMDYRKHFDNTKCTMKEVFAEFGFESADSIKEIDIIPEELKPEGPDTDTCYVIDSKEDIEFFYNQITALKGLMVIPEYDSKTSKKIQYPWTAVKDAGVNWDWSKIIKIVGKDGTFKKIYFKIDYFRFEVAFENDTYPGVMYPELLVTEEFYNWFIDKAHIDFDLDVSEYNKKFEEEESKKAAESGKEHETFTSMTNN